MIGCKKQIKTITGETTMLEIRPGVSHGAEYAKTGSGFHNVHNGRKGRFVPVINIQTPTVTDPEIISKLTELNNLINSPK
jgi:DnaJ-class molecular chaperone